MRPRSPSGPGGASCGRFSAAARIAAAAGPIEGPAAGALLQLPPCRLRIVLLAPSAEADVVVGLFDIGGVALEHMQMPAQRVAQGQTALVLTTTDFDGLHARLASAGVKFLTPPVRYPKRQASERSPAGCIAK